MVSPLLERLDSLREILKKTPQIDGDPVARQKLALEVRNLWLELEEPGDLIDRITHQPQENAMLRVALDLDLYNILVKASKPMTSEEIAKESKADPILIRRILRNLAALNHVDEVGDDTFTANKFSKSFTTTKAVSGAKISFEWTAPAWNQMPAFLRELNYRNPDNALDTPLQRAFGSNKHFFDLMQERPEVMSSFQTWMGSYRQGRPEFLDIFPAEVQLIRGFDAAEFPDGALFVDVAGGRGHEALEFIRRFPESKGRLILQEVPDIVKQVEKTDRLEVMIYDFFTPQTIKGARAYYFRMILHDWSDEKCVVILRNTIQAMAPGYSKIIINDIVLPDKGASRFATQSDVNMMALLAAMERSEKQWRDLLGSVGLEIVEIWRPREGGPESVIEAVLP